MKQKGICARAWSKACLAAGLAVAIPSLSLGQTPEPVRIVQPPAAAAPAALNPSAIAPSTVTPGTVIVEGLTAPPVVDGCKPAEEAKPFWSTHPPITPMPVPGAWIIPPSGPGYYSALDMVRGKKSEDRPPMPYGPFSITPFPFYDLDFRYLDKPDNTYHDPIYDATKRIHLGDNWLFSIGGEERIRYMNEVGGYARITGRDNTYELLRSRVYGDLWYKDIFRVYVEYFDAQIHDNDLTPLPSDVDHSDLMNLFIDLKVFEINDHPVYVRGGRQELLYGSQRLISPLDWANTRRTFEGVKGFYRGDKLDVDLFWVQPVIPDAKRFDSVDDGQNFTGAWATYRPQKGHFLDLYYLNLDNTHTVATGEYRFRDGFNVNTVGTRYAGNWKNFLWDEEGMYQFGSWANQQIAAGAYTLGAGYRAADVPMTPEFWVYWDWAEGDPHPGTGNVHRTFNQLFPFGHYYFGFLDLVGRQNIDDFNMQLTFWPTKWWMTGLQYHIFHLDSPRDALYNAAGTAIRSDPTGRSGTSVGNEIDFFTNFHLGAHSDILLGVSQLYEGNFIRNSAGPKVSPEFFYLQYSFKW